MNIKINENFKNIKETYLFSDIAKRVNAYKAANRVQTLYVSA